MFGMDDKKKKMDDREKEAKMGVLGSIKKMASDMMADDIKGMKKVVVAGNDEEAVKEGLDKAKELMGEEEKEEEPEVETSPESSYAPTPSTVDEVNKLIQKIDDPEQVEAILQAINEKKLKLGQ